jgi:hypothetical protein
MSGTTCGTCQRKIPVSPAGLPGKNAYTFLTASFTMPAIGSDVTITVSNAGQFGNRWAVVGQIIFIQGAGFFQVAAIVGTNQITVTNLGYVGNGAPTSTIGSNGYVSPAGPIGPSGTSGSNGVNGTARLFEVLTDQSSATISPTWATLSSYVIPADTLLNNGDSLVIKALYRQTAEIANFLQVPQRRVLFNGNSITGVGFLFTSAGANGQSSFNLFRSELEIIRTSSSSILVRNFHDGSLSPVSYASWQNFLGGINFSATNTLSFDIFQYVPSTFSLTSLTIDKIVS